ncbi:MAG: hypothetical protein CMF62_01390 [Magnetococcales bacterium]|nr:hypothetical protein [Magnetococcales bacterium]|tara:strand:+ start:4069 stop:4791 length:723 start_codon:yes stop_codon:yes gene_type:complete
MKLKSRILKYYKDNNIIINNFNKWSDKSKEILFKSRKKCIGNGENKIIKELNIKTKVGGQNSTIDLVHPIIGDISIKDMTRDDCILGADGCNEMRKIFRTIINPFLSWLLKYKSKCEVADKYYNRINKKYGYSRITIIDGIDRYELSSSNLSELNNILNEIKNYKSKEYPSFKSEYMEDILESLGNDSLQELLNKCVRSEATTKTLIIVHEKNGWLIVKDINKLHCPRITRGSPRINYKY